MDDYVAFEVLNIIDDECKLLEKSICCLTMQAIFKIKNNIKYFNGLEQSDN